jgi:translation elongation factor EF-Ts
MLAMHVAAASPQPPESCEVPADVIDHLKDIMRAKGS